MNHGKKFNYENAFRGIYKSKTEIYYELLVNDIYHWGIESNIVFAPNNAGRVYHMMVILRNYSNIWIDLWQLNQIMR